MACVHGSGHNISSESRTVVLSQLNTRGNVPTNVEKNSKKFNLKRARREYNESKQRFDWFRKKYFNQLNSKKLTFSAPIAKEEK